MAQQQDINYDDYVKRHNVEESAPVDDVAVRPDLMPHESGFVEGVKVGIGLSGELGSVSEVFENNLRNPCQGIDAQDYL